MCCLSCSAVCLSLQSASLCRGLSVCLAGVQGAFKACPVYWVARDVHRLKRPLLSYRQLWQFSWCTVSATPSFSPSPPQLQLSVVFIFVFCYLTISWPLLCKLLEQFSNPHTTQLSWEPGIQPGTLNSTQNTTSTAATVSTNSDTKGSR